MILKMPSRCLHINVSVHPRFLPLEARQCVKWPEAWSYIQSSLDQILWSQLGNQPAWLRALYAYQALFLCWDFCAFGWVFTNGVIYVPRESTLMRICAVASVNSQTSHIFCHTIKCMSWATCSKSKLNTCAPSQRDLLPRRAPTLADIAPLFGIVRKELHVCCEKSRIILYLGKGRWRKRVLGIPLICAQQNQRGFIYGVRDAAGQNYNLVSLKLKTLTKTSHQRGTGGVLNYALVSAG